MARRIVIRRGMSKAQIRSKLRQSLNRARNNAYFTWTCVHGKRYRIRYGSVRKGTKRRFPCGCTLTGS